MRRLTLALAAVAVVVLLAACGSSGRALREPERDVTSPTRSVPTTIATVSLPSLPLGSSTFPSVPAGVFDISASGFAPGGTMPRELTCAAPSPALRWQGIPEGTTELALVVVDPADGGQVYWMVTGIAPISQGVGQGEVPAGSTQLPNTLGEPAWSAPCPPPDAPQPVNFVLLALTQPASVPTGTPPTDAYRLLSEQAAGKTAILSGTAAR